MGSGATTSLYCSTISKMELNEAFIHSLYGFCRGGHSLRNKASLFLSIPFLQALATCWFQVRFWPTCTPKCLVLSTNLSALSLVF